MKRPQSVLVLIHSPEGDILLIERAKHPGFWQSVTGSVEPGESLLDAARREVAEETGIVAPADRFDRWHHSSRFEIFPIWRQRYAPGVTRNVEHVFGALLPEPQPIALAPGEHRNWTWLPWRQAAACCFSWSNRDAILMLPPRIARAT